MPRRVTGRRPLVRRAASVRRVLVVMGWIGWALAGGTLLIPPGIRSWAGIVSALALAWLSVWLVAKGVNVDVGQARESAFSRNCRTAELAVEGDGDDVVANWLALTRRLGFDIDYLCYRREDGELSLRCTRVRLLKPPFWTQHIVVVGGVGACGGSLLVAVDSIIPIRRDYLSNETTLESVLRYFATPYQATV